MPCLISEEPVIVCAKCGTVAMVDDKGRVWMACTNCDSQAVERRPSVPSPNRIEAALDPACPLCGVEDCGWGCEGGTEGW